MGHSEVQGHGSQVEENRGHPRRCPMPWRSTSPLDQTSQFIADSLRRTLSITAWCALDGVSRKTGAKWIARALTSGPPGLEVRARTPGSRPHQTPQHVVAASMEGRCRPPAWGAKHTVGHLAQTSSTRVVARALHGRRHVAPPGLGPDDTTPSTQRPSRHTDHTDRCAQRGVECRVPRPVDNRGRPGRFSLDGGRWRQPPSPRLSGALLHPCG